MAATARARREQPCRPRHEVRRRCLGFGNVSVLITFAAWVSSGVIFPVAMHLLVQELPASFHLHFLASQTLCGLVAVSYPQFGVTFVAVRCLFPALVPHAAVTADDVARLRAVDRAQSAYLLVAASVPMLAVGLLAGFAADNRTVILEFRVEDVDKEFEKLEAVVSEFVQEPTTMPWGNRALLFRDPDGNLVNLFTPVTDEARAKFWT